MTTDHISGINWKVGDRAKFVRHDPVFHEHEREGKIGTIVKLYDSKTCAWQIPGEEGVYITALADLATEKAMEQQ